MGIPFTIVFLCENVQLGPMVSSRIATGSITGADEMKLINFVESLYNENCLAKIFRVGLAHLAQ